MGAAAAHGGQIHAHLRRKLLGTGAGDDAAVVDDWSRLRHSCRRGNCRGHRCRRWCWRWGWSRCGGRRRRSSCSGRGRRLGLGISDLRFAFHDQSDRLPHRRGAAGRHQHRGQIAVLEGLHIHVGLVGLHHEHRLPPSDLVAGLLQPFHDLALRHGGAEGRHEDVVGCQNRLRKGRSGEFTSQLMAADQASSMA